MSAHSFHPLLTDRDECAEADDEDAALCGPQGVCNNTDGSYWCRCSNGFTNYGNKGTPCSSEDIFGSALDGHLDLLDDSLSGLECLEVCAGPSPPKFEKIPFASILFVTCLFFSNIYAIIYLGVAAPRHVAQQPAGDPSQLTPSLVLSHAELDCDDFNTGSSSHPVSFDVLRPSYGSASV